MRKIKVIRSLVSIVILFIIMISLVLISDEIYLFFNGNDYFFNFRNRKLILLISNIFLLVSLITYRIIFLRNNNEKIYGNWITKLTNNPIIVTDSNMKIIFINDEFKKMTGYSEEDVYEKTPSIFNSGKQPKSFYINMWQELKKNKTWSGNVWNIKKNGVFIKRNLTINEVKGIDNWEKSNYVGVYNYIGDNNVGEESLLITKDSEESFDEILNEGLIENNRNKVALMSITITNIKTMINLYSSDIVESIINDFVDSLENVIHGKVIIAEANKSDYLVILSEYYTEEKIRMLMNEIIGSNKNYKKLKNSKYLLKLICGISISETDKLDLNMLFKKANIAKYSVIEEPFKAYEIYSTNIEKKVKKEISIRKNLAEAIEKSDFQVVYQPQVEINRNEIVGAEALIRWKKGEEEGISTAKYISIAENNGLIIPLSNLIIKKIFKQINKWEKTGYNGFTVGINISPNQFYSGDFIGFIESEIKKAAVDPKRIEFEITERILIQDFEVVKEAVSKFTKMGIKLSIDDFGTGYASFKYLKLIKFNKIKIDREFIEKYPYEDSGVIAETMMNMGKRLGLEVVSEGVERREQLDLVKKAGCNIVQGYYYSKPLSAEEFINYFDSMNNQG